MTHGSNGNGHNSGSICPSKKKAFGSKEEAERWEAENRQKYPDLAKQFSYPCNECPSWHLTSMQPDAFGMAAIAAGVRIPDGHRFGRHNLRHSLSNWLVNQGKVDPKTVQEMLRHAKLQTTLDLYTQGDNDNKISAQDRFCGLIVDQPASAADA